MNLRTAASLLLLLANSVSQAGTITFDDLTLSPNSYFRTGASTTFRSGNATFFYEAPFGPCCWSGFTYSNLADTTTPGFLNDGSAITGDGAGPGIDNYAVGYTDGARLEFDTPQVVTGAFFTNTTYAFLAIRDGNDGNATPFVKGPFGPDDFFTLVVTGLDSASNPTGSVDIALADGTSILDAWTFADLSSLGLVSGLRFIFLSSDVGSFGINTPTYFAVDNLTTVPAPAGLWLLLSGIGCLAQYRRLRRGA
jgi:hypothetical protein